MRKLFFIAIIFIVAVKFSSCEYENYEPATGPNPNDIISFSNYIMPLMISKCAVSGCHEGTSAPNLTAGKAYTNLVDGAFVDTLNAEQSILYLRINGGGMPPANPLPASDISKVLLWIKQGAQNN